MPTVPWLPRRAWRERTDQGNARVRVPRGHLVWQRLHRAKGLVQSYHLKAITVIPTSCEVAARFQMETLVIDFRAVRLPLAFKKLFILSLTVPVLSTAVQHVTKQALTVSGKVWDVKLRFLDAA